MIFKNGKKKRISQMRGVYSAEVSGYLSKNGMKIIPCAVLIKTGLPPEINQAAAEDLS